MENTLENLIKNTFIMGNHPLTDHQIKQFSLYHDILNEWNQKMNLTTIEAPLDVVYKHFLDSVLLLEVVPSLKGLSLIDVGTGAGFPGVPLKIMDPSLKLCLFDSLKKRMTFLAHLCQSLGLKDVDLIHGRAEEFGIKKDYREQFDLATARAVAKLPVLLELCLPFVKVGGQFIALKGPEVQDELEESSKALAFLGGKIGSVQEFTLAEGLYTRTLVVVEKTKPTPKEYPRKAGTPQKSPIH